MYDTLKSVSKVDFDTIKIGDKLKSLISHADGIVLYKDDENKELEVEWSLGQETSITSNHISKLKSVIYLG